MPDPEDIRAMAYAGRWEQAVQTWNDEFDARFGADPDEPEARAWLQLGAELGLPEAGSLSSEIQSGEIDETAAPGDNDGQADSPDEAAVPDESDGSREEYPNSGDIPRFLELFRGREGVHARQWTSEKGERCGYSPVRKPLTGRQFRRHLDGDETLGVYVVGVEDEVHFIALDLDITKSALENAQGHPEELARLRRLVHAWSRQITGRAASFDLPFLVEDSGYKGRHFWTFFDEAIPAELGYRLAHTLADRLEPDITELSIEAFPKQPSVEPGGLGNLIKLPLGVHRRSGRKSVFMTGTGEIIDHPWSHLRSVEPISPARAHSILARLENGGEPTGHRTNDGQADNEKPESSSDKETREMPLDVALADTSVASIVEGCPAVAAIVERAQNGASITHDQAVVLRHTLGHFPAGVDAVNGLLRRASDAPPHAFLTSCLRGHPISCRRIHERLADDADISTTGCDCHFPEADAHYPSPVLHAE